ncbi:hypothetical protein ABT56_17800 [Photobacterium aquae]|uniref:Uncharacterized protein n=1 Tax=Photobacterium aquae TaxID=1195763 RepID=A0A0J1GWN6_9GAMM|nr:hypothetical protein ABT56_17800 [Photobacterium aquae]
MINYYLANRDELKKVFNKCHYDYRSLIKLKKWNEANESTKTYQCTMVGRAASKLNVFTFEQPIG